MIITTTDILQGYEITEYLGLAHGVCQNQNPMNFSDKTGVKLWGKTVSEITASLEKCAAELGADAIIGVNYFQEKSACYAYGTAVKVRKI